MKRFIAVFAALTLSAVTLTSCGGGGSSVVTVATNAEFPPFEYVQSGGLYDNYSGVDIAISLDIANALNKKLVVSNMDFEAVLAAVSTGQADFAAAGLTYNEERAQQVDFSMPYCIAEQYIIVKAGDSSIKSANDILNKRVGVAAGFTGEYVCQDLGIADLTSYRSGMLAAQDLKQDKIDCVVIDSKTAEAIVAQNPDMATIADPENFESEQYAIAVKKGNKDMLSKINGVLEKLIADGKINEYVVKYSLEQ